MTILVMLVAVAAVASAAAATAADAATVAGERAEPPSSGVVVARGIITRWERLHRTLTIARLLAYLVAGASSWAVVAALLPPGLVAVTWGIGSFVLVAAVEYAARSAGDRGGPWLLSRLAPFVQTVSLLLMPLRVPLDALNSAFLRAFPLRVRDDGSREAIAARFRQMVAAEAEVSRSEVAILYGVFSLRETSVYEIMVPRVDIVGIDTEAPWSEVVDRVRASEHARLPVYEETVDEVVGILYAKDILHHVLADAPPPDGWQALVRQATFIPRSKPIGEQLRDFRASRTHITIVVDEFGGTAGLVTIEDILEEIVGEIRDEHDEEDADIESRDDTRFWIAGRVSLDDAGALLGVELERDGISTVGGLVYSQLGRVPRAGETFEIEGFRVVVEQVQRRKVKRVYFERVAQREPSPVEAES